MRTYGDSLRNTDTKNENLVMTFLEEFFFPIYTTNYIRYTDMAHQMKGIDCQFDYKEKKNILVDVKVMSHYINKPLDTRGVEISYIAQNNKLTLGWFYDETKKTEYYMYPHIFTYNEKERNLGSCNDIFYVDIIIVGKKEINDFLLTENINREKVFQLDKDLRERFDRVGFFESSVCRLVKTKHLVEVPIMLTIPLNIIEDISLMNVRVGRKNFPKKIW